MSECVVRMEKPKSCEDCDIATKYQRFGTEIYCPFMGWYADYDKCPIILQLPEDHGRLVDMRDIEQMEASALDKQDKYFVGWNDAIKICQTAPAIVPAERSET